MSLWVMAVALTETETETETEVDEKARIKMLTSGQIFIHLQDKFACRT
jgi:hypothetical protein